MWRFLSGMICGAVLLYAAMHYHLVRSDEGFYMVPKLSNNLSNIYVDTREFTLDDWRQRKIVAAAIIENDQAHLLEDASLGSFRTQMRSLVDGLFHQ